VRTLECPQQDMTDHLMESMHPDRNANIVYTFSQYAVTGNRARTNGQLSINGVTKPAAVTVNLAQAGQNLQISGNVPLDMTEFNVDPPVVLLGALRVRPRVRIEFDGVIAAR